MLLGIWYYWVVYGELGLDRCLLYPPFIQAINSITNQLVMQI